MRTQTWIDAMVKDIEEKNKKDNPDATEVKLSESDMNTLADIMIKKMSNPNFDIENSKDKKKEPEKQLPDDDGEIPIEEEN